MAVDSLGRVLLDTISYNIILRDFGVNFSEDKYYLRRGVPMRNNGWLLHISVSSVKMIGLLKQLIPLLEVYPFPYKIVKDEYFLDHFNAGSFGSFKIGKIITIYIDDEVYVDPLMGNLLPLVKDLGGPTISTDFYVTDALFVRYGSFNRRIELDRLGNKVLVMDFPNSLSVIDRYNIPPVMPRGIENPFFKHFSKDLASVDSLVLGNKAMPVKLIKNDLKGNVWFGLYLNKFLILKCCVIKQGRRGMFPDRMGRDMLTRMSKQVEIGKELKGKIATPRIIDFFEEPRRAYLVMSYIWFGRDLIWLARDELRHLVWFRQPIARRRKFIRYYFDILTQIKALHDSGYVHRDITGTNFYIDFKGKVYLIDLELAYSIDGISAEPPFRGGTPGYMSPEQMTERRPSYKDDIYSLGSLLIMIVAGGIEPFFVVEDNRKSLRDKLIFLSKSLTLTDFILKCLSERPEDRFDIEEMIQVVGDYLNKGFLKEEEDRDNAVGVELPVKDLIQYGLNYMASDRMTRDGLWFSIIESNYDMEVFPWIDKDIFWSIYRGVGGVIWSMGKFKRLGFDISGCMDSIKNGLEFIDRYVLQRMEDVGASFYYGKTGIAVVLAMAMRSGFLPDTQETRNKIEQCFVLSDSSCDVINGIAGRGLALVQCKDFLGIDTFKKLLNSYAGMLLKEQKDDGAWADGNPGFGFGVAGIVYFLLVYWRELGEEDALAAAKRGLGYLMKISSFKDKYLEWRNDKKSIIRGHGWSQGHTGIALTLLRAYELIGDEKYFERAERLLRVYPELVIMNDLTQAYGVSGFGEVCLEAFRISKKQEWWDRATWIYKFLAVFSFKPSRDEVFWLADNPKFPTADFMNGNSGILHFLLRYMNPGTVSFPLLP